MGKEKQEDIGAILRKIAASAANVAAEVQDADKPSTRKFMASQGADLLKAELRELDDACSGDPGWRGIVRFILPFAAALFVMLCPAFFLTGDVGLIYVALISAVTGMGLVTYYLVQRILRRKD